MTTMTIHADDIFALALKRYAAGLGKSINQTVKDVFTPILGLAVKRPEYESPFVKFFGAARGIDESSWKELAAANRTIDAEIWK